MAAWCYYPGTKVAAQLGGIVSSGLQRHGANGFAPPATVE
jgi:hypothetical protein